MSFHDIFDELETIERVSLLAHATDVSFHDGEVIIEQDEPNERIYILTDGVARVERRDAQGERVVLAELGLAEIFGEVTFLTGLPASARVVAVGETLAMSIDHSLIRKLVRQDAAFAGRFFHSIAVTLAHRLIATNLKLGS